MNTPGGGPSPSGPASLTRYFLGVAITVFAVFSQYFVPQELPGTLVLYGNLPGDLLVVYGIPVIAFFLLIGGDSLRDWKERMGTATWEGLRFYGLLSLLTLLVLFLMIIVYEIVDPAALGLLNRTTPVLQEARGNPWFFVGFSFVIGAFEETIFRGFMFGYWRDRAGGWLMPATWTSALFAAVHLYYGTTYGVAFPLFIPGLFLFGFAMAATYRYSGGNLVVPGVLHGAHDAFAFLTLISPMLGAILSYLLILIGGLIGLIHYLSPESAPDAGTIPPGASW